MLNKITLDGERLDQLRDAQKKLVDDFRVRETVKLQKTEQNQKKMLDNINRASRGKKLVESVEQIQENQEEQIEILKDLVGYQREQIKQLESIFASLEDSAIVSKMIQQELQKEDKSILKDFVEKVGVSEATALLAGAIKSIVAMSKIF